jgi:hypothetical protein
MMLSPDTAKETYDVSCLNRVLTSNGGKLVRTAIDGDVLVELGAALAVFNSNTHVDRHIYCVLELTFD